MSKVKKIMSLVLASAMMSALFTGCGNEAKGDSTGETVVLRILENDTAKKEGYLQELLDAFNEKYKDKFNKKGSAPRMRC